MLLAIDIGNTNIVIGCIQNDEILFKARIATDRTRTSDQYGVEIKMEPLQYEYVRWVVSSPKPLEDLNVTSDTKRVKDLKDNPLLLFAHEWSIRTVQDRNKGLELEEFSRN